MVIKTTLCGVPVTMVWHILGFWMGEMASRYGGVVLQLRGWVRG